MNKKRLVKIAACSLLIGSIALVGCKKKTKDKTSKVITTKQGRRAISFDVFIDGKKYSKDNNTIKFEYNGGYDYTKHIKLIAHFNDDTEEEIGSNHYDTISNLNEDSGVGKYVLTIIYEDLDPVNIFLEVTPYVLDFSNTRWNIDEVTYNGKEQEAKLLNLPTGIPDDMLIYKENKNTYAGNYTSSVTVVQNTNYEIINFDASLYSHNWKINKLCIDLSTLNWDYENPFTYDEQEKEIKLVDIPDGALVEYSNNKMVNAGTYTARATFVQSENVETTPGYLEKEFTILKKAINFSNTYWDDKKKYVFNNKDQTIELTDIPRLPSEVTISISDNVKKDAGTYVAKLTVNTSDNYEIVGLTDELKNHTWTIAKGKVVFNEINAENKVYDGYSSTISYKTNLDLSPDVFYYKKAGADDSEYSTSTPTDAGAYTVKVVINDTSNYVGASATCDFVIGRKMLYVSGNVEGKADICVSCGKEGVEQTIPLNGYDENLMKFRDGDPNPVQKNSGTYIYHDLELKDSAKKNYLLIGGGDYNWVRNGADGIAPYIGSIKFNKGGEGDVDQSISGAEFEAIKYFYPGNKITFTLKGDDSAIFINDVNYTHNTFTVPNDKAFYINVESYSTAAHYYNFKIISNECGINKIKLNGTEYNYNNSDINYVLTDETLKIDFDIFKERLVSLKANNVQIDLNNPTITLDDFSDVITIDYQYKGLDNNTKDGQFKINITRSEYVKSFDVLAIHLINNSILAHHVENGFNLTASNELIYDIAVNFNDKYKGYTYKIMDADTNELVDFKAIKARYNLYIEIYDKNGKKVSTINNFVVKIDDLSLSSFNTFTNPETLEKTMYKCMTSNELNINITDTLYKYLDVYINDEKKNAITYDNEGAYREKITFKKTFFGLEYYSKDVYVDVIYSNKLSDYGTLYYSSGENKIYNGNDASNCNVFAFDSTGESNVLNIYDLLNVTIKDDFTFNPVHTDYAFKKDMSKIELLDKYSDDLLRFKLTLVIHDGDKYITFYAFTYFSGSYSSDTKIVGEKTIETFSMDSSYKKDISIVDDVLDITNSSPLHSYSFELKNVGDVLIECDGEDPILDLEGIKNFDVAFSKEGTYTLTITAVTGKERSITINVSGNFENVFETQIGDGDILYIDNKLETNFNSYDDENGLSILVGFFGSSSADSITDDTVEIKLRGTIADFIYKDEDLTIKANTPTDTFTVLYDRYNNPYIELFMESKYIKIYLADKPDNDISISVGGNEFGIFYKKDYSYYGDLGTSSGSFYVKPNGFSNSLTITTKQIYDDYSYAIIIVDSTDEFDQYTSYSEMESKQKLFRVKDSDTLTREFTNFDSRLIYILPLGSTDDVYNPKKNAQPLIIDMPIYYFNIIAFDNDSYYFGYDISGNEITNSYSSDYESGEFRFKVGSDKGSSTEGKYITFDLETTYLYNDDLFYRDTDLGMDVKCYDESTNTFKVKHNVDQGSVIIFFTEDHSRFVILEFVDRID